MLGAATEHLVAMRVLCSAQTIAMDPVVMVTPCTSTVLPDMAFRPMQCGLLLVRLLLLSLSCACELAEARQAVDALCLL